MRIVMRALQRIAPVGTPAPRRWRVILDQFVVASHLHNDEVIAFLRSAEPLLNQPPGAAGSMRAASVGSMPTAPEEATKLDLVLRLRMSPIGRFLFRRKRDNS
jgi:hypothetical protein